jgi:hypothetical protein
MNTAVAAATGAEYATAIQGRIPNNLIGGFPPSPCYEEIIRLDYIIISSSHLPVESMTSSDGGC